MSAKVNFQIDYRAVGRLVGTSSGEVEESVAQTTAQRVRNNIMSSGRVDTGRMLRAVRVEKNQVNTQIVVDTDYAMFQEEGVIGPIYPKRAKVLRFEVGGVVVFAKKTRGFSGAHFMRRAFESLGQSDVHT